MIRATAVVRRPAVRDERVVDTLTLDHRARQGRHFAFTTAGGLAVALELDKAVVLDDGDAVKLEDGRLVRVRAAAEALMEVTSPNPARLLKAAWLLGQRHLPTESTETALYVPADGGLMETLRGLGVSATPVDRPFRPDKGTLEAAGAGHHGHEHHGHEHHDHEHHDHEHHGHEHHGHEHHGHEHQAHEHHHAAASGAVASGTSEGQGHQHGPGCGHDHERAAHERAAHEHAAHDHDHAHHDHEHHGHTHAEAQPTQSEAAGGHRHGPGCGHDHRHG